MRPIQFSPFLAVAPAALVAAAPSSNDKDNDLLVRRSSTGCGSDPPFELGVRQSAKLPGSDRTYAFWVPTTYSSRTPTPLVLSLQDAGRTSAGRALNFEHIAVYPSISSGGETTEADNVAYTNAILDVLEAQLCIDKDRVYTTDKSHGAGSFDASRVQLAEAGAPVQAPPSQETTELDGITWTASSITRFPTAPPPRHTSPADADADDDAELAELRRRQLDGITWTASGITSFRTNPPPSATRSASSTSTSTSGSGSGSGSGNGCAMTESGVLTVQTCTDLSRSSSITSAPSSSSTASPSRSVVTQSSGAGGMSAPAGRDGVVGGLGVLLVAGLVALGLV